MLPTSASLPAATAALAGRDLPRPGWLAALFTRRTLQHGGLWGLLYLANAVSVGLLMGALPENMICYGLRLPFMAAVCYLNLYWLLPRYYHPGQLVRYGLLLLAGVALFNLASMGLFSALWGAGWLRPTLRATVEFTAANFVFKGLAMLTIVALTTGLKLSKDHLVQKQQAAAAEKEFLATELALLKSQVQPHFFFNTLNNLYALTLKKSDQAPEVVLKLAELMSYLLYETQPERTLLAKELTYINAYIDLESLRFARPPVVDFQVRGDPQHLLIPPLLLLPFIENSFKHGLSSGEATVHITIELEVQPDRLALLVRNPCADVPPNARGLGLRNVKRRLDLLYAHAYTLRQERRHREFITHLELRTL